MKKHRKPESFVKKPQYPGGSKALTAFIIENLKYPKEAAEKKIEGTVRLRLDIDRSGKVVKAHVIQGIGHGCNEEAQRVAYMLVFKTDPPKSGHILYHKEVNVPFRLPKAQPLSMSYQYTSTSKKKSENQDDKPKQNTHYTYTLTFKP